MLVRGIGDLITIFFINKGKLLIDAEFLFLLSKRNIKQRTLKSLWDEFLGNE